MTASLHTTTGVWARTHRAALVIAILGVALAVTLGLLVARLASSSPAAATTSISTRHIPAVDNGCSMVRVSRPC